MLPQFSDLEGKAVLNLGCGSNAHEGWTNMDRLDLKGVDVVHDACIPPWPFEDGTFDHILAAHFFQTIPWFDEAVSRLAAIVAKTTGKRTKAEKKFLEDLARRPSNGLITVMNECWRVLKPGGHLHARVPTVSGNGAFQDPEHRRYFVWATWDYFGRPPHLVPGTPENIKHVTRAKEMGKQPGELKPGWYGSDYGIRCWFDIIHNSTDDDPNQRFNDCILRKPLPVEAPAAPPPIETPKVPEEAVA